jgi:LmbE family N-acetylglucosaminyl deacetylase
MPKRETILCICAHSDDQIFGPGGTLAKYAKEGKKVFTIVLSFGEMSHPHFKPEVIIKTRVQEAKKADRVIGGSGVIFLGMKEGKFRAEAERRNIVEKLVQQLAIHTPSKIFTHSTDDPHPDHRAVCAIVKESYDQSHLACPVYTFDVWTPFSTMKRDAPKLIVDVTKTYRKKLQALRCFKSQLGVMQAFNWYVYTRMLVDNVLSGILHRHRFAEVFYKLR